MSEIKVNKISPLTPTGTVTLGGKGLVIGGTGENTTLIIATTQNPIAPPSDDMGIWITDGTVQSTYGYQTTAPNLVGDYLGTYSNHPVGIMTNNTTKLLITPTGNVGIGTTTPKTRLDVLGPQLTSNATQNHYTDLVTGSIQSGAPGEGVTGVCQIILPYGLTASTPAGVYGTTNWPAGGDTMLRIKIMGHQYRNTVNTAGSLITAGASWEVIAHGYFSPSYRDWSGAELGVVEIRGNAPFSKVRLANKTNLSSTYPGRAAILLGDDTTTWKAADVGTVVQVTDLWTHYTGNVVNWTDNSFGGSWAIEPALTTEAYISANYVSAMTKTPKLYQYTDMQGNVGIGTTTPSAKLNVIGESYVDYESSSGITGGRLRFATNTTYGILSCNEYFDGTANRFSRTGGIGKIRMVHTETTGASAGSIEFLTGGTGNAGATSVGIVTMAMRPDGKVGIGTTTPSARLQALNSVGNAARFGVSDYNSLTVGGSSSTPYCGIGYNINFDSGNNNQYFAVGGDLTSLIRFQSGGFEFKGNATNGAVSGTPFALTDYMTILNSGNVGIGTTGPQGKLEVWNGATYLNNGRVDGNYGDQIFFGAAPSGFGTSYLHKIKTSHSSTPASSLMTFSLDNGQYTFADVLTLAGSGLVTIPGTLSFNSGYGSAAIAYGCRAWVKFNASASPAVNASGNVSSITWLSAGSYTMSFINSMVDANYCVTGVCSQDAQTAGNRIIAIRNDTNLMLTTSCSILTAFPPNTTAWGGSYAGIACVAVFR